MYVFSFPVFPGSCFPPHRKTSSFFLLHGCFLNTRERFLLPHGIRLRTRRTMPTVNYIRRRFHLHPGAPRLYKGREHVSTAWSPLLSLPCRHHRCRSGPCSKGFVSFTGILNSRIVAPRRSSSSDVRRPAFLSVWIFAAFKSTDANFLLKIPLKKSSAVSPERTSRCSLKRYRTFVSSRSGRKFKNARTFFFWSSSFAAYRLT